MTTIMITPRIVMRVTMIMRSGTPMLTNRVMPAIPTVTPMPSVPTE